MHLICYLSQNDVMKLSAFLICLLPFFAVAQDMSPYYKIYDTRTKKITTLDQIAENMSSANVVFFGEEHNDSTGHYLEQTFLKKLIEKYPGKTALSLEMIETDCQTVLNEYLGGLIREKDFLTDARVWHNYKDYRPLVETAKANKLPVIAANAPGRYVNMVNRMGLQSLNTLSAIAKTYLPPLPIDTATGLYYQHFLTIMGGHGAMMGMQLFQAQNLWDATMGWSIANFYNKHKDVKIMQINGGFHSEEKLGAAAQLLKYSPGIKFINIAAYSDDGFDNPDWSKYSSNADYIILTDPKLPKTF